jgi:hypothetical protein
MDFDKALAALQHPDLALDLAVAFLKGMQDAGTNEVTVSVDVLLPLLEELQEFRRGRS